VHGSCEISMKSRPGTLPVICNLRIEVHILCCHGATGPEISQPALRYPAAPATRVQSCAGFARKGGWRVVFSSCETLERKRREQRAEPAVAGAFLVAPVQALLRNVFSVLFPSDCRLCRTPLDNISRIPVCTECLEAIEPVRAPQCVICGDRLPSAQLLVGDGRCHGCRDFEPEFARAMSFGEYEGGLRGLVHLLKYENVLPVASVLGNMMADTIVELLPACGDSTPLVVPVPLHKSKRSDRGFNQAELIARAAVKRLPKRLELATGVLVRQRATISQVGLTREQRIENMRDAFRVRDRQRVRGSIVILVDDVMTTGTTLSECARVLKQAGAEQVFAATVARAFQGGSSADKMFHVEHMPQEEEVREAVTASV
jgi:ComF family protein